MTSVSRQRVNTSFDRGYLGPELAWHTGGSLSGLPRMQVVFGGRHGHRHELWPKSWVHNLVKERLVEKLSMRTTSQRKGKEKERAHFSWQAQGFGDLGSSRFGGSLARSAWSNHALIVAFTDNEQRFMRFAVSRRRVLRVFCIGWLRALEWKFQSGCFNRVG